MASLDEAIKAVIDEIENHTLRCAVEDARALMRKPHDLIPIEANRRAARAYGLEPRDVARYTGRIAALIKKARTAGRDACPTGGCYD
jgi:hypothetical protein